MAQIDTHLTIGNLLTAGVMLFGIGGAWASVRAGMTNLSRQVDSKVSEITDELKQMREETMRRDVSEEKMKLVQRELERFEARMETLEKGRKR